MTSEQILEFINKNPIAYVATVEDSQPRVRAFMVVKADKDGILFSTAPNKDVYRQLMANPALELCFYDVRSNQQIRVTGTAQWTEDPAIKELILEKFTFLKPVAERFGMNVIKAFFVGEATAAWMEDAMAPKQYTKI